MTERLAQLYPATATLAGYAICWALLVGLPLGFLAAARQNSARKNFKNFSGMLRRALRRKRAA